MNDRTKEWVDQYKEKSDIPNMKRLTFDDLARMQDDFKKYGPFAVYLLSRDIYNQEDPEDLRKDQLTNKEIHEWLEEIADEWVNRLQEDCEEGEE